MRAKVIHDWACFRAGPLFVFGLPGIGHNSRSPVGELGRYPGSRPRKLARQRSALHFPSRRQEIGVFTPHSLRSFGLPGIEPGLHAPHACVLPVYYSP